MTTLYVSKRYKSELGVYLNCIKTFATDSCFALGMGTRMIVLDQDLANTMSLGLVQKVRLI